MAKIVVLHIWRLFLLVVSLQATNNAKSDELYNCSMIEDSTKTKYQSDVDSVLTSTSPWGANSNMEVNDSLFTTNLEDPETITSSTKSSGEDVTTATSENEMTTTTSNFDDLQQEQEYISSLEFQLLIYGGPDVMSPGKQLLSVTCDMSVNRNVLERYSISIYRKSSDSLIDKIITVEKMKNTSATFWMKKKLLTRTGVQRSVDCLDTSCSFGMFIDTEETICEDAEGYVCIMTGLTNNGPIGGVSVSQHRTRISPAVNPYYIDDIEVSDPGHVNSEGQHEYTVHTWLKLKCSGSIGSDRLKHKWHVAYLGDPCSTATGITVTTKNHVGRDGCNNLGISTASMVVPDVAQPIIVWCWISYANNVEEECDQLNENTLMKGFTILPGSYIHVVKPERTTYKPGETLELTCRYNTSQALDWYFRPLRKGSWKRYHGQTGEIDDWKTIKLTLPNLTLWDRGWYACLSTVYSASVKISSENQRIFVDVLHESCRGNGIVTGEGCVGIMSGSSCDASNGTVASIHTQQKSVMLYWFAFYVLQIPSPLNIGLNLTANTLSWKNFVWADGSPLTFMQRLSSAKCLVCYNDYPVAMAISFDGFKFGVQWIPSAEDTYVACEWQIERQHRGLRIPTSTSTYIGNKVMFQCTSGEFISAVYVCDRTSDCSDVSDERNCVTECAGATFQCDYGGCISASKSCDFINDCADGSDELLCNYPPCGDGYWQCASKECIPEYDVCDGDVECIDGSDEADVLCIANSMIPSRYTFRCFKPDRILPLARLCDGFADCFDKYDEACNMIYYPCLSWAVRTTELQPSEVLVDYGISQYGPLTVECSIGDSEVHTSWGFSDEQDISTLYTTSVASDALWFETEWEPHRYTSISYKSRNQKPVMMASSSSCVQYIRACGYFTYSSGLIIEWKNGNDDVHKMYLEDNAGCFGLCTPLGCRVHFDFFDLQENEYYDGNENFGWIPITEKHQLPVTALRSNRLSVMGVSRLICSEGLQNSSTKAAAGYLECKNNKKLYDPALQCLMNFDPTGEPIACRDLTHLDKCENFTCPENYAKCPGSFCLHMRYICDGTGHCPHREDERDCESPNCTNHYRCRGGRSCIPFVYLCDGVRHCQIGDDEQFCEDTCPKGCTCQGLSFTCDAENVSLRNITSNARWIRLKNNMENVTKHFPLSLPLLTSLTLKSCAIHELRINGQAIFKNITALRHLDISSNQITIIPEGIFSDIIALRTLILNGNPLVSISKGVFTGLKALRNLQMSDSNIKSFGVESKVFSDLSSLEYLDMSSNMIGRLPRSLFSKLSSLHTLILTDNPLVYIDGQAFSKLYSLTNLQLSHILSERIESELFNGLQSLMTLNLSSSGIKNLGLRSFQGLGNLETLDIKNNHFDVQEFMFDGLDNLQYLYADSYKMCCIKPATVLEKNCFAPKDLISSCSNLIGSDFLRGCLWIIGFSALFGNILVIIYRVVIDKVNLRKSHSIFVLNLSISDFIMAIYMIIIASVDTYLSGRYVANDLGWRNGPLCITAGCLSLISSEMSTFAILMITVDRFIAIVFPLSLRKITWKTAVGVSALLWILSLILAIIPQGVFPSNFKGEFYSRSSVCLALPLTGESVSGQEYSVAIFIGLNGLLFLIILVFQICIHRSCKDSGSIATTQNRKREIAIARSLFLVVATDFLCWFPIGVLGAWSQLGGTVSPDTYAWVMVFVLPINSAINPFVYTYMYIKRKQKHSVNLQGVKAVPEAGKGKLSMSDGFKASNNLKEIYFSQLFKPQKGNVSLAMYSLDKKLSPTEAYQIANRIMKAVSFLHQRYTIHGNIADKNVYISIRVQAMKRASLMLDPSPIGGDHDSRTDMLQYGVLMKKLLRMVERH